MPTQEEIRQLLNKRKKINRENDPPTPLEAALLRQKNETNNDLSQSKSDISPSSVVDSGYAVDQKVLISIQTIASSDNGSHNIPLQAPIPDLSSKENDTTSDKGLPKINQPEAFKELRQKASFYAPNSETIPKQLRNKKLKTQPMQKEVKNDFSETIAKQNTSFSTERDFNASAIDEAINRDLRNNPETKISLPNSTMTVDSETIAKQDFKLDIHPNAQLDDLNNLNHLIAKQSRNNNETIEINQKTQFRNNCETKFDLDSDIKKTKSQHQVHAKDPHPETIAKRNLDSRQLPNHQLKSELRNNSETDSSSLRNNSETLRVYPETKSVQLRSTKRNNPETIAKQKPSLPTELLTPRERVLSLSTLQQRLLMVIFESCSATGSRESEFVKNDDVARVVKASADTVRVSFNRVISAGLLQRLSSKSGRNGWSKYHIAPDIFLALKSLGMTQPNLTLRNNSEAQSETQSETKLSSKLVSNINTNLLGSDDSNFSRSGSNTSLPDFLNADISSLSNFGVYKKQLMDLHNQKQSFELNQMEDFIWKFKEYVSDSEKVRGVRSIPALFVTLARQLASGYDPLESIQTPEQKLLEGLIERNKKALMELKRKKEESKAIEFELWFEKLNRQERDELAPPNSIVESGSELQKRSLMGYFDTAVWNG